MRRKYCNLSAVVAAGIILYLLGAVLHLKLAEYSREPFIFGDTGDAFLNMWVMEHTVMDLARGNLDVLDGRIFWPENHNTLLWSDNLFVPTLAFAVFRAITGNIMSAFHLTGMLLSALTFTAFFLFFFLLVHITRHRFPGCPRWAVMFVPLFTYLACFSEGRLAFFTHFQNLSSFWLITEVAGIVGHLYYRRRTFFALAVASEVALLYSAVYAAVLGICFLMLWAIWLALTDLRGIPRILRENIVTLAVCVPLFALLASAYLMTPRASYSPEIIHGNAMRMQNLLIGAHGPTRTVAAKLLGRRPAYNHEAPAYLGLGLAIGLACAGAWAVVAFRPAFKSMARSRLLWGLILAAVACGMTGDSRIAMQAAGRFAILLVAIAACLRLSAVRAAADPYCHIFVFPLLCAVAAYGLAYGPAERFLHEPLNPSIWGLLSLLVPGITSMRVPGRMAVVGQGMLFGLLLAGLCAALSGPAGKRHFRILVLAGLLIGIQFTDQFTAHCSTSRAKPDHITPTPAERAWFSGINGPVLVVPTRPFHRNTYPMLYFNNFPDILLINGYSGRSSALFERIMQLGDKHGSLNSEQIGYAVTHGCRYLVICKPRTSTRKLDMMRNGKYPLLFESDHFLVFAAPPTACRQD